MSSFTWDHSEFKVWVVLKLVPYDGVLVKEYVGEILRNFDKFQVVPSSVKIFTTNLNGPLSPTVSRPARDEPAATPLAPATRSPKLAWGNKCAQVAICSSRTSFEHSVDRDPMRWKYLRCPLGVFLCLFGLNIHVLCNFCDITDVYEAKSGWLADHIKDCRHSRFPSRDAFFVERLVLDWICK